MGCDIHGFLEVRKNGKWEVFEENIFPLYGDTIVTTLEDKYEVHSLILPHGEPTKSFQSLPKI